MLHLFGCLGDVRCRCQLTALRADRAAGVLLTDSDSEDPSTTQIDEAFTTPGERRGALHDRIQERTLA